MTTHTQKILIKSCLVLILVLTISLLLKSAMHFDYLNFDDDHYVTNNSHVNTGLSLQNFYWAFTNFEAGHWHPLTWLSHQLDVSLFGLQPAPSHVLNILLHCLNALLVFLLLVRLFRNPFLCFFCALLFAIHPLRLESVIWISERKDVLSLFFGLAAFWAYLSYRERNSMLRYIGMLFLFSLSLLAKPTFVSFPFLILLLDFWPLKTFENHPQNKIFLEKLPVFFLVLLFSAIAFHTQAHSGGLKLMENLSWNQKIGTAFVHFWLYWAKTLWPAKLSIFYPWQSYSSTVVLLAFSSFLGVSLTLFKLRFKYPYLFFAWAWFFISLLPMMGLLQIGGQSIANRWTYLPHVGLTIALCGALNSLFENLNFKFYIAFTLILYLCAFQTHTELFYWKNSESLFRHALELNPQNFLAHNNLGTALDKQGRLTEATKHYEMSLQFRPSYSEALNNLGQVRARQGDYRQAKDLFEKTLQINPHHIEAQYNLALTHYYLGEKQQAFEEWLHILKTDKSYRPAWQSIEFMANRETQVPCEINQKEKLESIQNLLKEIPAQIQSSRIQEAIFYWKTCIESNLLKSSS